MWESKGGMDMKVSITNLSEFAEKHKQEPPFFTNREFNQIMLAVRNESRKNRFPPANETPRQRKQRIENLMALDSAIIKLRTLTREEK